MCFTFPVCNKRFLSSRSLRGSQKSIQAVSLTGLQTDGCLPAGFVSSCAEGGGMLMEVVGWSEGAAAQAPGDGWTELSNTLPCCENGHESFRSS